MDDLDGKNLVVLNLYPKQKGKYLLVFSFSRAGNKPGYNQQNPPTKKAKVVAIYGACVRQKQRA
jgi:hypothetical protein